ncbi:MAG TPA: condensation domain-containing protein, partial [Myxococcota bacterium]|nr:condensation domain-containing protein [Myxococcota bacterium]
RLPEYMVPAVVVLLERLPLTSSGKLDRGALPAPAEGDRRQHAPVAPRTDAERTLSEIWSELLSVDRVGVHDSFFSLGGDSILALRVLSQARDRGLRLTARAIFQHQTIAALAAALEQEAAGVEAAQGPVTGEVPLTPIQRSFLGHAVDPNRYTMVQTLETDGPLDCELLIRALTALAHQHDALRARFVREGAGWSQVVSGSAGSSVHLAVRREAAPDAHRLRELLEAANRAAHDRLDIARGPLMAVEYLELGPARGLLVLVAHHLIVDLVSWGILIEDLERAYGQLERGEVVALGAKGTSFQRWAERLHEMASRPEFVDAEYWERVARAACRAIPRDGELGPSTVGMSRTVETSRTVAAWLDEDETARLLGEVAGWHGASIDHVLLAALVEAFWQWAGIEELAVSVEGHGRLPLFDDLDISRTVGWFTTRYPVLLRRTGDDLVETLSAIGQRLREVPRGGIGHGELDAATAPEVGFNYLGHASMGAGGRARFRASADEVGPLWDPGLRRPALIEVDCVVARGRLLCNWTYSTAHHRERTVQALARDHLGAVRRLVASGARGTPGTRIDRAARGPQGRAAQALSHAQETFWRLHRLDPDSPEHTVAQAYRLRGALDVEALRRAFEELVRRHEVLRTVFPEREGAADPTVAPLHRWQLARGGLDGAPGSPDDADLWR